MEVYGNTVSTKVADTTLQDIEEYAENHGMSRSEAVRYHVRRSLDQEDDAPGVHAPYGLLVAFLGFSFTAVQYGNASGAIGPAGTGLALLGIAHYLGHRFGFLTR